VLGWLRIFTDAVGIVPSTSGNCLPERHPEAIRRGADETQHPNLADSAFSVQTNLLVVVGRAIRHRPERNRHQSIVKFGALERTQLSDSRTD